MRATRELCIKAVRDSNNGEWRLVRAASLRRQARELEEKNLLDPEASRLYEEAARLEQRSGR
jgi:hypothetical protein